MSRVLRKPTLCKCENKDADKLLGNCEADQWFCFHYLDSTIPQLPKSTISSLSSGCTVWFVSDLVRIHIVGFLTLRLKYWPTCSHDQHCGFWPGPTQTRLYNHWRWLEAWNFGFRRKRDCTIQEADLSLHMPNVGFHMERLKWWQLHKYVFLFYSSSRTSFFCLLLSQILTTQRWLTQQGILLFNTNFVVQIKCQVAYFDIHVYCNSAFFSIAGSH